MGRGEPAARRATPADAEVVADVWLRAFADALPTVRRAHSDDDVRSWIRDVVVPGRETWVATVDDAVAAMMVLVAVTDGGATIGGVAEGAIADGRVADGGVADGGVVDVVGEIEQLYVDPPSQGCGLGSRLVDVAKQRWPAGLELWTFQVNVAAQRFYERHGFVAVERTDGSGNEEQEPDVRYRWQADD